MLANGFGEIYKDVTVCGAGMDWCVAPDCHTVTTGATQLLGSVSRCFRRRPSPDRGLKVRVKGAKKINMMGLVMIQMRNNTQELVHKRVDNNKD